MKSISRFSLVLAVLFACTAFGNEERDISLRQKQPIDVTEDSPDPLVFKAIAEDVTMYKGRVVHGITGEPIADAIVMRRPSLSDINTVGFDHEKIRDILPIGPELNPADPIYGLLKEDFKSKLMTRTDPNGDFQITLPKPEGGPYDRVMATKKDFLGAEQRLKYMVPTDKDSPEPIRYEEFKPDDDGLTRLPAMKLLPAGTIIIQPAMPDFNPMDKYRIRLYWRTPPEDETPWLKYLWATHRELKGAKVLYRSKLQPNQSQSVYVPAGVELTMKIRRLGTNEWAPIVIHHVKLQQGQILDLGRRSFQPALEVAVKVVDSKGEPVEGVAVSCADDDGLVWSEKVITDKRGRAKMNVAPHSNGRFFVRYLNRSTKTQIKEGTPYEVAGKEDAGRQFTLQISDEMLYQLFK